MDTSKTVAVPVRKKKAAVSKASPRPKTTVRNFPQDDLLGGSVTVGERRLPRATKAAPSHRYAIGDRVKLNGHRGSLQRADGAYQVLARLPHEGGPLQYRVRSDEERYERIVIEEDLELYHIDG